MNILVIGSGAREHAMLWKLAQNPEAVLFNFGPTVNPGITSLVKDRAIGNPTTDIVEVVQWAQEHQIDLAWIGPEDPLEAGIVDALEGCGIACIGPTQKLAQIESSKGFTRDLLEKYDINASPTYQVFTSMTGIEDFLIALNDQCVVKPDGLTGGKGVRVMGDQLHSRADALQYCEELFAAGGEQVVIEEKMIGQEFSLMSFSDGKTLLHMPAVQDHKRVGNNDEGLNTGGMGSYSDANLSLPFLTEHDIATAHHINEQAIEALQTEYNEEYKGIIYGGYMATATGVRLIEFNARFGDPEVMNVLSMLETDFMELTKAIMHRSLDQLHVKFVNKASVCKYVVPAGYPASPVKDQLIDVSKVDTSKVNMFYASVDQTEQGLIEKGSRTVAVVATANTITEAEQLVETEIQKITGPVIHRSDIGTSVLIQKRVEQMQELRKGSR